MTITLLAAVPQKAIALTLFAAVILVWLVYLVTENRRTTKSNVESFLNAPNRKAAPDDEVFEGPRLDRFLGWALVGITIMAFALPFYWLGERGRQEGAINGLDKRSVKRGFRNYEATFQCLNCHGASGGGGVASWTVPLLNEKGLPDIDPKTNRPKVKSVTWTAPRINNVALRYRENQLRNVLIYGRGTNKPMPAWGLKGGGPGNEQQIDDLVNYLKHEAIKGNEVAEKAYKENWAKTKDADKAYDAAFIAAGESAKDETSKDLAKAREVAAKNIARLENTDADKANDSTSITALTANAAKAKESGDEGQIAAAERALAGATKLLADSKATLAKSDGQILYEANCARCHTKGWSWGEPTEAGNGFYGPKLSASSLKQQFPDPKAQAEFIKNGVDDGKAYGSGGVNHFSGGGMPYFGNVLSDKNIDDIVEYERGLNK